VKHPIGVKIGRRLHLQTVDIGHRTGRIACIAFHALGDGALDRPGRPQDRLQIVGVLGTSQLVQELLVVAIGQDEEVGDVLTEEAVRIETGFEDRLDRVAGGLGLCDQACHVTEAQCRVARDRCCRSRSIWATVSNSAELSSTVKVFGSTVRPPAPASTTSW
jgi:hypothetical protein